MDEHALRLRWQDARLAIRLLAADDGALGGARVCASPGPVLDAWMDELKRAIGGARRVRRLPSSVATQALVGGVAWRIGATGVALAPSPGVLAESDGALLVLPNAERLSATTAAVLAQTLDTGRVPTSPLAGAQTSCARLTLVAIDESDGSLDRMPDSLCARLSLQIDLNEVGFEQVRRPPEAAVPTQAPTPDAPPARAELDDGAIEALVRIAERLGVSAPRSAVQAALVACRIARLRGRATVESDDLAAAVRLVLLPRAAAVVQSAVSDPPPQQQPEPSASKEADPRGDQPPAAPVEAAQSTPVRSVESPPVAALSPEARTAAAADAAPSSASSEGSAQALAEAVCASLPADLLGSASARRAHQSPRRGAPGSGSGQGALQHSSSRGRPVGAHRAASVRAGSLDVLATLIAAVPWQRVRGAAGVRASPRAGDRSHPGPRLQVRRDDFRIRRFVARRQTSTVFVLDASGSAALNRLAEAKSAVEQMLSHSYVRRDRVSVVTFGGQGARVAVPATRSLVRARRCLNGLAGGGGTPLACGLDEALQVCLAEQRLGRTPLLVVLTDGRANLTRDGIGNRARAFAEARQAAAMTASRHIDGLWIDTAPRAQAESRLLAQAMGARYLELPFADSDALINAVRAQSEAGVRTA